MLEKSLPAGLAAEQLSRAITGTDEVTAGRSAIAAGAGAGLGYVAAAGTAVGLNAVGLTAAAAAVGPAAIPVAVLASGIAFLRSLFD